MAGGLNKAIKVGAAEAMMSKAKPIAKQVTEKVLTGGDSPKSGAERVLETLNKTLEAKSLVGAIKSLDRADEVPKKDKSTAFIEKVTGLTEIGINVPELIQKNPMFLAMLDNPAMAMMMMSMQPKQEQKQAAGGMDLGQLIPLILIMQMNKQTTPSPAESGKNDIVSALLAAVIDSQTKMAQIMADGQARTMDEMRQKSDAEIKRLEEKYVAAASRNPLGELMQSIEIAKQFGIVGGGKKSDKEIEIDKQRILGEHEIRRMELESAREKEKSDAELAKLERQRDKEDAKTAEVLKTITPMINGLLNGFTRQPSAPGTPDEPTIGDAAKADKEAGLLRIENLLKMKPDIPTPASGSGSSAKKRDDMW